MPQAFTTMRRAARDLLGRDLLARPARDWAPVAGLAVLSLVVACSPPQRSAQVNHYGASSRPSGYEPPGPPHDPWGPWIREAAQRFDVPERWIREVMRQESGGRVSATSPVGAMGLMQVMPGTYRELRSRYALGDDPYHPYDSIMAGTAYIREMYDLYGSPAFLAAYNAGPRRLEDYLWGSRGLPNETRNYVARIGPNIIDHHPRRRVAPEVYAAAEIPLRIPAGPRRMDSGTMLALREQRNATDPGIQVAQLPPGPVTRMDPIPDGSTYGSSLAAAPLAAPQQRVQVAALGPNVVAMDPIPDGSTYATPPAGSVTRMDPIPDGSTYGSLPVGSVTRMDPIPDGSTYAPAAPAAGRGSNLASLVLPGPVAAPASRPLAAVPAWRVPTARAEPVRGGRGESRATAVASLSTRGSIPARPILGAGRGVAAAPQPLRLAALPSARAEPVRGGPGGSRSLGVLSSAQAASLRLPAAQARPIVESRGRDAAARPAARDVRLAAVPVVQPQRGSVQRASAPAAPARPAARGR